MLSAADESGHAPDVAMDAAGNAVAVWRGSQTATGCPPVLLVARYDRAADAWTTASSLDCAQVSGVPRVAVNRFGNALVVWEGLYQDDIGILGAGYGSDTGTWSRPVLLASYAVAPEGPSVWLDDAGNGMAFWWTTNERFRGVRAARFDAVAGWRPWPAPGLSANFYAFDANATGEGMLIWQGFPTYCGFCATSIASTGTWGSSQRLGQGGSPRVAVDGDGNAVAVWTMGLPSRVRSAQYEKVTDTWSPAVDISAGIASDVDVSPAGAAMAVWSNEGRIEAAGYRAAAGAWDEPVALGRGESDPYVAVDRWGNALAVWFSKQSQFAFTLQSAYYQAAIATWYAPVTVAEVLNSVTPQLARVVMDDAGRAVLVWSQGTVQLTTDKVWVSHFQAPLEPPIGLRATAIVGNRVTLSWTVPEREPRPTGFVIEGGISPGEVLASLPTGTTAPAFTFDAPTGAFYVRVHAVSGPERSGPSNEIRLFVDQSMPPSAPANLLGLVNGSDTALSWTNTYAGGAPTSLWLYVTGALTTVLPLPMGDGFTYASVPPGTYTLSVIAANASGISAPSNTVTLSFPEPCTGPPGAPTNMQTWTVGRTIYVAWSPPAAGPAVTSYTVHVSGAYVGTFGTTGRALSGMAGPGTYGLRVEAGNVCGTGPSTPLESVVIP